MSTLFSGHYLRNRSTLDIGVLSYIGIVEHKEHPPEVWPFPPVTPCICTVREQTVSCCLLSHFLFIYEDTNSRHRNGCKKGVAIKGY